MMKFFVAYLAATAAMLAIDMLWLGVIAKPLYQQGIGHLMADRPNIAAAVAFYALFPVGLILFAVAPSGVGAPWGKTLLAGAMFGLFAYATYDLTNLATLSRWPLEVTVADMVWGTFVTALASVAAFVAIRTFAPIE